MNWLLVFIPVTVGLEVFAPDRYALVFMASCLAILPLARWLGLATEQLAARFGEGVGGLLNATFGNAAVLVRGITIRRLFSVTVIRSKLKRGVESSLFSHADHIGQARRPGRSCATSVAKLRHRPGNAHEKRDHRRSRRI